MLRIRVLCFASLLYSAGFGWAADTSLIKAVKSHKIAEVRNLLKSHVDVNAAQGDGATALHWAVQYGDAATVELLLHAGSRVNVANDLGVTPLYLACTNRDAPMIEKLL